MADKGDGRAAGGYLPVAHLPAASQAFRYLHLDITHRLSLHHRLEHVDSCIVVGYLPATVMLPNIYPFND